MSTVMGSAPRGGKVDSSHGFGASASRSSVWAQVTSHVAAVMAPPESTESGISRVTDALSTARETPFRVTATVGSTTLRSVGNPVTVCIATRSLVW